MREPNPFFQTDNVSLLLGDAREVLRGMPEGSVQCVVTSPPYWGLRSYDCPPVVWGGDPSCKHSWGDTLAHGKRGKRGISGTGGNLLSQASQLGIASGAGGGGQVCSLCGGWLGQLGLEPQLDLYVDHLIEVFRDVRRVLRDDGVLWVNMGDGHASTAPGTANAPRKIAGQGAEARARYRPITDLKPTDLLGVPFRFVLAMQADGWWWRSCMPWIKTSSLPESCDSRPSVSHEYIFMFTKSGEALYWTHPRKRGVREKPKPDYVWVHKPTRQTFDRPPPIDPKGKLFRKLWQRRNRWKGHSYFYDADSVRLGHAASTINDAIKGYGWNAGKKCDPNLEQAVRGKGGINDPTVARRDIFNPSGRSRRTSDWTFEAIDLMIEDYEVQLAHLREVRNNGGGMLCDFDGSPLAMLVNPEPTREAHYAAYPTKLVRPMILASTSEAGCCAKCGAPRARKVIRTGKSSRDKLNERGGMPQAERGHERIQGLHYSGSHDSEIRECANLGFVPTCSCPWESGSEPCRVLDPFVGTATTLIVAREEGRRGVGIDLSEKYLRIAKRRIETYKRPREMVEREDEGQLVMGL